MGWEGRGGGDEDEERKGGPTDPAFSTGTRIGLDNIWWIHSNIETQTESHTPRLHLLEDTRWREKERGEMERGRGEKCQQMSMGVGRERVKG